MAAADDLARLGAPARVRAALATLPAPFADSFAADAVRLVKAGRVLVRPADDAPLLPARTIHAAARRWLLIETDSPPGAASLAVARYRLLDALLRFDAGRLLARCNGFRRVILPAWETAHGRPLDPAGDDWPLLPSRVFG